jgi:hypothetical protein
MLNTSFSVYTNWQLWFQDPISNTMIKIVELCEVFGYALIVIAVMVGYFLFGILLKFSYKNKRVLLQKDSKLNSSLIQSNFFGWNFKREK